MKKIIKRLQNVVLLMVGILLFTSCNKDEDEKIGDCDYQFVSVVSDDGTAEVNTAEILKFTITKGNAVGCNTSYKMTYTVKRDGEATNDGIFAYNDVDQVQGMPFVINPITFEGKFTVGAIGGNYEVIFTIVNAEASSPIQIRSVLINYTYPSIVITQMQEVNTIFAKQRAGFKYGVSGGGTPGNYEMRIVPEGGVSLGSSLLINGTEATFENFVAVDNEFKFIIIPTEVGETVFKLEVKRNGVLETRNINFGSRKPEFDITIRLRNSGGLEQELQVKVVMLNNYNESLRYDYVTVGTASTTPEQFSNILGAPVPFPQIFNVVLNAQPATVTVRNEYGFSVSKLIE